MAYRELRIRYSVPDAMSGPTPDDLAPEVEALEGLAEGLVRANEADIARDPDAFPCCLQCGLLRYRECELDKRKAQTVLGARELLETGAGTCIDLACLLAAIKRVKGVGCRVVVEPQFDNRWPKPQSGFVPSYHAVVLDEHGEVHDPQHELQEYWGKRGADYREVGKITNPCKHC